MPWLRLDDGFAENEKVLPLSSPAFRLHVTALLACSRNLTDGFVSDARFVTVAATARVTRRYAAELENAGLWQRTQDGWIVNDYLDYNPSAEKVKAERQQAAERQARSRAARRHGVTASVTHDVTHNTPSVTNAAPPHPTPTRTTTDVSKPSFLPSSPRLAEQDGKEGFDLRNILGDVA